MYRDPLSAVLSLAPLPESIFGPELAERCDDGVMESLQAQGLLVPAPPASHIVCAACDVGESVPWEPVDDGSGLLDQISYVCETHGTEHRGPVAWTQRHRLDFQALARLVGEGLGSRQEPEEVEHDVAYRWPRVRVGGVPLMVVVARTLSGPKAADRWRALGLSPQAIVLTAGPVPQPPSDLPSAQAGGMIRMSLWSILDVDD